MKKKTKVVAAMSVMAAQLGIAPSALAQDCLQFEERCECILRTDDPKILQDELTKLLLVNPDDPCIPVILSQLGGGPTGPLAEFDPDY